MNRAELAREPKMKMNRAFLAQAESKFGQMIETWLEVY